MPVPAKLQPTAKPVAEPRAVLGPGGNRVAVAEDQKRRSQPQKTRKLAAVVPALAVRSGASVDSTCSSDSNSSSASSVKKMAKCRRTVKSIGARAAGPVSPRAEDGGVSGPFKRCDWITANSDPLYTSFHDAEWGVPVHDDRKLFELLVFSQALAELSWPMILQLRDVFRKFFDNFDPSCVAHLDEKKMLCVKVNGKPLLSEPKLRAVIENAKQTIKIQEEFGSFSNYLWSFVNHKPIRNGFRYGRQVPVKTPKAEVISKNMMRRGFCCVGPTVIYSFMQVTGMVNDHLLSCFRYQECNADIKRDFKPKTEETEAKNEGSESPRHPS
ncbi:probable GMP synthase [glutamine-hydrolyzing] [Rhodamnia argentea]|uniref:Probable GMP synthase [glutamine-hydrolyzing] n=1 Tax=Rhodamnia argentea TaxID=178133 RepID=A0A8B8QGS8_9MYRT|nr:probable GMP synthase [glutamine-hydrolyzing] [Rhodamnia argentea]